MSVNLSTKIAGIRLSNCMYNASGVNCITGDELHILGKSKFTAVIQTKSCTLNSREGNPLPRYYDNSICSINSSGLPNLGYKYYSSISEEMSVYNKPYIVSVSGLSPNDNIVIVDHLKENLDVNGIELNLSCPNIVGKPQIGYDFCAMSTLLRRLFEDYAPTIINNQKQIFGLKLPPYFDISHFTQAADIINEYKNHINFLTCINSIGNGIVINPQTDSVTIKPKNGFGGIGGSAIKATALANVRKFYELTDCSIIGCGGVANARDVYEHILCGASAVQVGTQFKKSGIFVFECLSRNLQKIMLDKGYNSIEDFRGQLKYLDC